MPRVCAPTGKQEASTHQQTPGYCYLLRAIPRHQRVDVDRSAPRQARPKSANEGDESCIGRLVCGEYGTAGSGSSVEVL